MKFKKHEEAYLRSTGKVKFKIWRCGEHEYVHINERNDNFNDNNIDCPICSQRLEYVGKYWL